MSNPDQKPLRALLVTGGAGYIGSHTTRMLVEQNVAEKVVVLDDLSEGYRQALVSPNVELVEGNVAEADVVRSIFEQYPIDAVIHFAAFIQVGESVKDPLKYYRNNTAAPLTLLEAMQEAGCRKFILSSTAAVYGEPKGMPIDETHPKDPINPYGASKSFLEDILAHCDTAFDLKSVCLRYFNASGSSEDGVIGEAHQPETHLIPRILMAISGETDSFSVFGTDYDTSDGTCVRDFIHVLDLARAHLKALSYLVGGGDSLRCNLGTGTGFSVKEMIDAAEKVTGKKVPVKYGERREGDPPILVANPELAERVLGWKAKHTDVHDLVESAWKWFGADHRGKYR
ncbi:MAG: UDP-glucose 4-epimerase GalE [Verrucomicrobiota bacterium]